LDPGTELARGLVWRPFQRGIAHPASQLLGEMTGLIGEDPSLAQVDPTLMKRLPHPGQTFAELEGEIGVHLPGPTGQSECCLDFGGGDMELVPMVEAVQVGDRLGDGMDVGVQLGLKMRYQPAPCFQQFHPVKPRQQIPIDTGQDHRQEQTWWDGF